MPVINVIKEFVVLAKENTHHTTSYLLYNMGKVGVLTKAKTKGSEKKQNKKKGGQAKAAEKRKVHNEKQKNRVEKNETENQSDIETEDDDCGESEVYEEGFAVDTSSGRSAGRALVGGGGAASAEPAAIVFPSPPDVKFIKLETAQASRILYSNPVCFLSTVNSINNSSSSSSSKSPTSPPGPVNVMAISWLMPSNNYGGFSFTIHKSRFSYLNLLERKNSFVLSVANANQIPMLLEVGKVTGKSKDKFDGTIEGLSLVRCGQYSKKSETDRRTIDIMDFNPQVKVNKKTNQKLSEKLKVTNVFTMLDNDDSNNSDNDDVGDGGDGNSENKGDKSKDFLMADTIAPGDMAISGTVAHMICKVVAITNAADDGHAIVVAQVEHAFVHYDYWQGTSSAKCFVASSDVPPTIKFLGSQKFGYIIADDVLRPK